MRVLNSGARTSPRQVPLAAAFVLALLVCTASFSTIVLAPPAAHAQFVDDTSDAIIGKADTRVILDLIRQNIKEATDAKVTELRRSKGAIVCGSVNVKNKDGLYLGERGFVADLSKAGFGRVPEGPELANPKSAGFVEKEAIRQLYFEMCLE